MALRLKTRRSAGVPVTRKIHAIIARGNAARDRGDWGVAAEAYAEAVDADPALYHVWIQLGHASHELDSDEAAAAAYRAASDLRQDAIEPRLYLAHIIKRTGDRMRTARAFADVLRRDTDNVEAARELAVAISPVAPLPPEVLGRAIAERPPTELPAAIGGAGTAAAALDRVLDELARAGAGTFAESEVRTLDRARGMLAAIDEGGGLDPVLRTAGPLVFDITDLVGHFRNQRLPTGIQRVQIEVLTTLIAEGADRRIEVCCFVNGRDYWIGIAREVFVTLAELASSGADTADPEWVAEQARLFVHLALADPFVFPDGATLVNLGTSWWIYDYFRLVRDAKRLHGIRYVPFVHDFIPIVAPEHCVSGVIEDFVSWAVGVFDHADFYLVNSHSTGEDLRRVARRLGRTVDADRIEVVPLDADFRRPTPLLPAAALARWGLHEVPFALFVSTIESRKNHIAAFDAWAELIRIHGSGTVPRLVCVGRRGWMNDAAFQRLETNPKLNAAVTLIPQVSDEELALLYRACLFTVYPSHYEGWGLPVTEALSYGKVPVVAANSSLPEAGGEFGLYFEPGSLRALVTAVEQAAFDDAWRHKREQEIRARFAPRPWAAIARQIDGTLMRLHAAGDQPFRPARAERGLYYPTALYRDVRIWSGLASGEVFRIGDGWLWPETSGCRTTVDGGELRIAIDPRPEGLRIYLRLAGLASGPCAYTVTANGRPLVSGRLRAGETRWTVGTLDAAHGGATLTIFVRGEDWETIRMSTGGTEKTFEASLGVVGFMLCDTRDRAARVVIAEAAAVGSIEELSAYRDRQRDVAISG